MLKVLVMVSGGGTNLQAIIDGVREQRIKNTEIVGVISNNHHAFALERAKQAGIPATCVSAKDFANRVLFNDALLKAVNDYQPDLIVLAGFLVVIPQAMIRAYEKRIINIHPSLLPAFGGKGYYGIKVHQGAIDRGVKYTGATVHFVDDGTDTGPIIMQKVVAVLPDDDAETLQKRVMEEAEWQLLPDAINQIAMERVDLEKIGSERVSS